MACSPACERNKRPILERLQVWLAEVCSVVEIGSGTGQHALYFAEQLPWLRWQPTDTGEYFRMLARQLEQARPANLCAPLELDVRSPVWPVRSADAVFTANTLHYMSKGANEALVAGCAELLPPGGLLLVYGPFRYGGAFTAPSNARFDEWLKASDLQRGVRDFEWLEAVAAAQGLHLRDDVAMPANNQLLIWQRA